MVEFSESQTAWDNRQHPGSNEPSGLSTDIEKHTGQYSDGRRVNTLNSGDWELTLRQLRAPELSGNQIAVSGVIEIESSGEIGTFDITLERCFHDTWERLVAETEKGEFELACFLGRIDNRGGGAF